MVSTDSMIHSCKFEINKTPYLTTRNDQTINQLPFLL